TKSNEINISNTEIPEVPKIENSQYSLNTDYNVIGDKEHEISNTEIVIKDDMIVPKTYRSDVKASNIKKSTFRKTGLNQSDSFIKIKEESFYNEFNDYDNKPIEISKNSTSSEYDEFEESDKDIDISDIEEEDEILNKLFKQNKIDMVCNKLT